jgi:hypothetical protein
MKHLLNSFNVIYSIPHNKIFEVSSPFYNCGKERIGETEAAAYSQVMVHQRVAFSPDLLPVCFLPLSHAASNKSGQSNQ